MPRQLPPLNSLRAFLAVASHLNFSKAAAELNVTPAAVSHQIKGLEEYVGTRLLSRTKRRVLLTEAGDACLPELREAFGLLNSAMSKVHPERKGAMITVSVAPAFASKWLMPRLETFVAAYPEIDVRVAATASLADLNDGTTDIAIRFGRGKVDGAHVERLLSESMAPLCAPGLLKGEHPIRAPGDLRHHQLIHDVSVPAANARPSWKTWFDLAGISGGDASRGLRFTLADLALQAAINGAGVVLGRLTLARDDIEARRLVLPFKLAIPMDYGYFVLTSRPKMKEPSVVLFRDWLLANARERHDSTRLIAAARKKPRSAAARR